MGSNVSGWFKDKIFGIVTLEFILAVYPVGRFQKATSAYLSRTMKKKVLGVIHEHKESDVSALLLQIWRIIYQFFYQFVYTKIAFKVVSLYAYLAKQPAAPAEPAAPAKPAASAKPGAPAGPAAPAEPAAPAKSAAPVKPAVPAEPAAPVRSDDLKDHLKDKEEIGIEFLRLVVDLLIKNPLCAVFFIRLNSMISWVVLRLGASSALLVPVVPAVTSLSPMMSFLGSSAFFITTVIHCAQVAYKTHKAVYEKDFYMITHATIKNSLSKYSLVSFLLSKLSAIVELVVGKNAMVGPRVRGPRVRAANTNKEANAERRGTEEVKAIKIADILQDSVSSAITICLGWLRSVSSNVVHCLVKAVLGAWLLTVLGIEDVSSIYLFENAVRVVVTADPMVFVYCGLAALAYIFSEAKNKAMHAQGVLMMLPVICLIVPSPAVAELIVAFAAKMAAFASIASGVAVICYINSLCSFSIDWFFGTQAYVETIQNGLKNSVKELGEKTEGTFVLVKKNVKSMYSYLVNLLDPLYRVLVTELAPVWSRVSYACEPIVNAIPESVKETLDKLLLPLLEMLENDQELGAEIIEAIYYELVTIAVEVNKDIRSLHVILECSSPDAANDKDVMLKKDDDDRGWHENSTSPLADALESIPVLKIDLKDTKAAILITPLPGGGDDTRMLMSPPRSCVGGTPKFVKFLEQGKSKVVAGTPRFVGERKIGGK